MKATTFDKSDIPERKATANDAAAEIWIVGQKDTGQKDTDIDKNVSTEGEMKYSYQHNIRVLSIWICRVFINNIL